jgi:hypothetical protein
MLACAPGSKSAREKGDAAAQKIKTRYSESSPEVIAQARYVVVFAFTTVFSDLTSP